MLVTAAIVPGPPAFVAELMGSAAHELDDLRDAADSVLSRAVSDLVAASGDSSADSSSTGAASAGVASADADSVQLVIVGPGEPGEFNAAGPVSFVSFGRDVVVPALVDRGQGDQGDQGDQEATGDRPLPTPLMVARHLASRDVAAHPEHAVLWASARWITTSGSDATALGEQLRGEGTRICLILVADGAACHGPKAPRAEDSRAPAYEDAVCAALASGQGAHLAQIDADLGRELGATLPQVWPVLLAAADGEWIGELAWRGAPYGVGWAVAAWRRNPTPAASWA
ncbi:MAG TPA: hypothetical protein VIJ07_14670 [Dermatophilaceae bacterium]